MVVDTGYYLNGALKEGKSVLAEGANAALLDLDHGTYPYVTSSSTTAGGVCTGLGLPPRMLTGIVGVVKAYTTRVGSGPFPTELQDQVGERLRTVGGEFGTTTGRPRRCGWIDLPVIQYSHALNGYDSINITKLDVLTGIERVKLGVSYTLNGRTLPAGYMPSTLQELGSVEVVYEEMEGWSEDISHCRAIQQLPRNAQLYLQRIEQLVGVPVSWVGVGPGREDMARCEG
jgi:adenylosuccinate synthase